MAGNESVLLLGADYEVGGEIAVRGLSAGADAHVSSACAISVGGRTEGAPRSGKQDPNEDAVFVRETESGTCLLVVADAHYGADSSHRLLRRIAQIDPAEVTNLVQLSDALAGLRDPEVDPDHPSETTLLVAVLQRGGRRGFALAWGDSSLVWLSPDGKARSLAQKSTSYVTLARPEGLARERAQSIRFLAPSGGLLLAYTDGVDECHYRRPQTSVGMRHLEALVHEVGMAPEAYARRLAEVALEGVDGNPGGEDNLALVVART